MITLIDDLPDNILGFHGSGKITGADYEEVLIPALEDKLKRNDKVRLLYHIGKEFTGFAAAALWDDAKTGLHHWGDWEKIALVTDVEWLAMAMKGFGFVMPGKAQVFDNDDFDAALAWLQE